MHIFLVHNTSIYFSTRESGIIFLKNITCRYYTMDKERKEGEKKVSVELVTNISAKDSRYVKKQDTVKEQKKREEVYWMNLYCRCHVIDIVSVKLYSYRNRDINKDRGWCYLKLAKY